MIVDTLVGFVNALRTRELSRRLNAGVTGAGEQFVPLYKADWAARKIVDIPAQDATREWRSWRADAEQIERLEASEQQLGVQQVVTQALTWSRLYGGAAIIIVERRVALSEPLDIERVGAEGIARLIPVSRARISTTGVFRQDAEDPLFGMPEMFVVGTRNVHPSRVVLFRGLPAEDRTTLDFGGGMDDAFWGMSALTALQVAIANAQTVQNGVSRLVEEAKIDIVSIAQLGDKLTTAEARSNLIKRFELFAEAKSSMGVGLLEKDEEAYDQKQVSFANLHEIMTQFLQILSAASDIPATRLIGRSPAGMNATGESDLRNYYDMIGAMQRNGLSPAMRAMDEALIRHALGDRPPEIWYEWRPLWTLSDKERAEVAKLKAEASETYARMGVLMPETLAKAVQSQLIDDGTYPGLEAALEEEPQTPELVEPAGDDEGDDEGDDDDASEAA